MQHSSQSVIVKALEDETVVWFEPANNYLLMKAPAYSVLVLLQGGMSISNAAGWFAPKYNLPILEAERFVKEIIQIIKDQNKKKSNTFPKLELSNKNQHKFQSGKYYKFRGVRFCFHYETKEIEDMFHPPLKHLKTNPSTKVVHYYLCNSEGTYVLENENKVIGQWGADEIHFFKGKLFMELLNNTYQMQEEDWMCVLHAAAVCDGESCLLFTGHSGCGKSTLTVLLLANGFDGSH